MAKRKKQIATVNRKLGIAISCRVQKPVLKDLDAYRKPLKLSRPAALVKLATDRLAGLKEPAEKLWEGAVERMFPASGVKVTVPGDRLMVFHLFVMAITENQTAFR